MKIADPDLRAVAQLWDELAGIPASEVTQARTHCLSALSQLIGASGAFWVGASRGDDWFEGDRMLGWRPRIVHQLYNDAERERLRARLFSQMKANIVDPQTAAILNSAGQTRAYLRRELVSDADWFASDLLNEILRPLGIEDRLLGARAVDACSESYIGLDRGPAERPFGTRERDLLLLFLHGAPQFHREQLRAHGIGPALTPRERDVMVLLLTDRTEREIAAALGLTWRTTHQHVVSIARKLGVKGRVGVMAWWLRHRREASSTPAD